MFRGAEVAGVGGGGAAESTTQVSSGPPNLSGDLDGLLSEAPCFRIRVRGYDRLEVDNYVSWAESELATGRRHVDHLLVRYGVCSAELEISRRLLAQVPKGQDVSPMTDRLRDTLRLAVDEARAMVDAAAQEADRVRAEARLEADARLRKAHEIKELAADTAEQLRQRALDDRAEAVAVLERARAEAAELVRGAANERDRLTGDAARVRAWLTDVRAEIDDLRRERDEARTTLRRLSDRMGEALAIVVGSPPENYVFVDNRVDSRHS